MLPYIPSSNRVFTFASHIHFLLGRALLVKVNVVNTRNVRGHYSFGGDKLKKWKAFENSVYEIQKQLSDDSEIIFDYKKIGKLSQRSRQVDVAILDSIGDIDLFIAIECKDYKTPIDVKEIEAFNSKIEDIQADRGVMVSSNGFSASAMKFAEYKRILLRTLTKQLVQDDIRITKLVRAVMMTKYTYRIDFIPSHLSENPSFDFELMNLYTLDNDKLPVLDDFIKLEWNTGNLPVVLGRQSAQYKDLKLKHGIEEYPVTVVVDYIVEEAYFLRDFKIVELERYQDVLKDELIIANKKTEEYFLSDMKLNDSYRKVELSNVDDSLKTQIVEARINFDRNGS